MRWVKHPPQSCARYTDVEVFIEGIDKLLRNEHTENYCGVVYVDDKTQPRFIKIFDPNNLGSSCSTGLAAPLPAWILSKIPPIDLPCGTATHSESQTLVETLI